MTIQKQQKHSPIKGNPLRYPGQSLDEEERKLIDNYLTDYFIGAAMLVGIAVFEWVKEIRHLPPQPILVSILALIAIIALAVQTYRVRSRLRLIRLGRDGERVVGQYLDLMRESGCLVFHDIIGGAFNIDHVIVSEHGIFTVETKTYKKRSGKEVKIRFDGESITIDRARPYKDIIGQAKAQTAWLRELLKESTGKEFRVRSAVVFPGWYVESTGSATKSDVWVLNPKALPTFINNQPTVMSKEDAQLAAYHLSRYVRTLP